MGRRLERIKNLIKEKKLAYQVCGIWEEAKEYLRDTLGAGEIVEVLQSNTNGYYLCPPGEDVSLSTRDLLSAEYVVRTSSGAYYRIEQYYHGFQSGLPNDILKIYDENKNLLYNSDSNPEMKLINNN